MRAQFLHVFSGIFTAYAFLNFLDHSVLLVFCEALFYHTAMN